MDTQNAFQNAVEALVKKSDFLVLSQPFKKAPLFKAAVSQLYSKSVYGHDVLQTLVANLLESEKAGSFLVHDGVAFPHLILDPRKYARRSLWVYATRGVDYPSAEQRAYLFFFCFGDAEFLTGTTTLAMDVCSGEPVLQRFSKVKSVGALTTSIILRLASFHKANQLPPVTSEDGNVFRAPVVIENRLGLHARASAKFVQTASQFKCNVFVERGGFRANGKRIMDVAGGLCAAAGTILDIETCGPDAEKAITALQELIKNKFGEPE